MVRGYTTDWVGKSRLSRDQGTDWNAEHKTRKLQKGEDKHFRDRAQKLWDEGQAKYSKQDKGGSLIDRLCQKFDAMSYRDLQKIAKVKGIRANQKKEVLCLALGSNVQIQGKHAANALHDLDNAMKHGNKKNIAEVIYANSDMPSDMVDLIASYASSHGK
jgi:predicted Zn-dependent protease